MRRFSWAALCVALLAPGIVRAAEAAPVAPPAASSRGFLLGDELRYDRMNLPVRTLADLVAIPASIGAWTPTDWGLFLTISGAVVAMMMPFDLSPDALLQRWVREEVGPWRRYLWTPVTEVILWGSIYGSVAALFFTGERELVSLMIESFAVSQLYHLIFKLSLGREGPMDADGLGIIHGPQASLGLFPAGTPSGHAASFFALMGAYDAYLRVPAITGVFTLVGLAWGASLILSDYHFISDVVWGAAMGFAIGHWVVKHRRSLPKAEDASVPAKVQALVVPMVTKQKDQWTLGLVGQF